MRFFLLKRKVNLSALLLVAAVFITGCKKKNEDNGFAALIERLPETSSEGLMMFAAIIDENEYYQSMGEYEPPAMGIYTSCKSGNSVNSNNSYYELYSTKCPDRTYQFYFKLIRPVAPGTYQLNDTSHVQLKVEKELSRGSTTSTLQVFENTGTATGSFTVTRADSIFSGTFDGTLTTGYGAQLKLTAGRFDLK